MEYSCTARQSGRQLVAAISGDVDLAVHARFQAAADGWAAQGTDVLLDCSGVTFMDSMGLRVLVQLMRAVIGGGHAFQLADPSEPVARVLELAGVQNVFGQVLRHRPAAEPAA